MRGNRYRGACFRAALRWTRCISLIPAIGLLTLIMASAESWGGKRQALVIGNSDYRQTSPLRNPVSDARSIAAKLKALGFSVDLGINLTHVKMEQLQKNFVRKLDETDIALFFYAGHGLQVAERNYLVPIDAKLEVESDIEFETVALRKLLDAIVQRAGVALVFLDACRNNPLANRIRTRGRGAIGRGIIVEPMEGGELLIAYATDPGKVADDGEGQHSPFTAALLAHLGTPGLEVQQMMKRVTQSVFKETAGRQRPWQSATLQQEVFLAADAARPPANPAATPAVAQPLRPPAVAAAPTPPPQNQTASAAKLLPQSAPGNFPPAPALTGAEQHEERSLPLAAQTTGSRTAPAAQRSTPLYKRWTLWVGLAAGALVTAAVITGAVIGLRQRDEMVVPLGSAR